MSAPTITPAKRAERVKAQIKLIEGAISKLRKVGDIYCNIDKAIRLLKQELKDAQNELKVREHEEVKYRIVLGK